MRNVLRPNLLTKMIILVSFVVLTCLVLATVLFSTIFSNAIEKHFGERAMDVAKLAASNDQIIYAFSTSDPSSVMQPAAETIRELTGASYVVIGNRDSIRYSHHNPEEIGHVMGTSNRDVFEEKQSVIYRGVGVSGDAAKAKTPIYNNQGEVIGVSSVGFLYEDINQEVQNYRRQATQWFSFVLMLGIIGAIVVARKLKKLFYGLEPEEISYLFKEKGAILDSIHDAIVAVSRDGTIVTMDKKAREMDYFHQFDIGDSITHPKILEALNEIDRTKDVSNKKILLEKQIYVMDYSPILDHNELQGIVFTFRPVSEIEQLKKEFSEMKVHTDNMRAQNHEFLNKLNTIYGLLKLNNTDEAIRLISDEVKHRQDFIAYLIESVKNPMIAACLLGKANRASERKVDFDIDNESELQPLPDGMSEQAVVTILANLIENAIEAAYQARGANGHVKVSFTDLGPDIIFDIEDNGHGISKEDEEKIFKEGYTTKVVATNHGIGLAIVLDKLELLGGEIFISNSDLGGARFTVSLPKTNDEGGQSNEESNSNH
ncbi:ATP-binding protein [Desertibacillus haloalkaliphilus]|uniref:ATP-binding protein n=1 Tax=Desertibacillus haloalkaliphilus TaxID=1328930 RepID=UPI001C2546FB|nr:sensor histidine kinase [Desertibacillus haloalkaliphilus]MBU8905997.1 sensor histidine kinase [Desertibacillus haloalkaliphilus]